MKRTISCLSFPESKWFDSENKKKCLDVNDFSCKAKPCSSVTIFPLSLKYDAQDAQLYPVRVVLKSYCRSVFLWRNTTPWWIRSRVKLFDNQDPIVVRKRAMLKGNTVSMEQIKKWLIKFFRSTSHILKQWFISAMASKIIWGKHEDYNVFGLSSSFFGNAKTGRLHRRNLRNVK